MSQEEEKIEQLEITEEQLDALYMFLSLDWESLTDDEKHYWRIIMEKIDPQFNDEE
jgi:archaellum component FlaC